VSKIDEDLKTKATEYSQVVTTIKQRKKRETYEDEMKLEEARRRRRRSLSGPRMPMAIFLMVSVSGPCTDSPG
jgi:Flp pilus assembly protein TadB